MKTTVYKKDIPDIECPFIIEQGIVIKVNAEKNKIFFLADNKIDGIDIPDILNVTIIMTEEESLTVHQLLNNYYYSYSFNKFRFSGKVRKYISRFAKSIKKLEKEKIC